MVAAPTPPPPPLRGLQCNSHTVIDQNVNVYLPNSKLMEVLISTEVMTRASF